MSDPPGRGMYFCDVGEIFLRWEDMSCEDPSDTDERKTDAERGGALMSRPRQALECKTRGQNNACPVQTVRIFDLDGCMYRAAGSEGTRQ